MEVFLMITAARLILKMLEEYGGIVEDERFSIECKEENGRKTYFITNNKTEDEKVEFKAECIEDEEKRTYVIVNNKSKFKVVVSIDKASGEEKMCVMGKDEEWKRF